MSSNKRYSAATDIYEDHLGRAFRNNSTNNRKVLLERMYQRLLTELASNRFKWSGMPDSVDLRFMELTLFYQAVSIFYFDKRYDKFFALRGGGANWLNMMDNPVGFTVVGLGKFRSIQLSATKETENGGVAVPIWANYLRMPDLDIVKIYSTKLAELDLTIEINSANARQSKVLVSSESQRLSVDNVNRQAIEGVNGIKVSRPLGDNMDILALDLGVNPDTIEKLHILRTRLWNECMGLLGIENANQDKKERLVAAEVDANDDQTSMMRYVNLNARRMACDRINTIYPELNLSVDYYTEADREAEIQNVGNLGEDVQ